MDKRRTSHGHDQNFSPSIPKYTLIERAKNQRNLQMSKSLHRLHTYIFTFLYVCMQTIRNLFKTTPAARIKTKNNMGSTNNQVIEQLTAIAQNTFSILALDRNHGIAPGRYTAAELAANCRKGDKEKRPIYNAASLDKRTEIVEIKADNFSCTFLTPDVFRILAQFEKLERISARNCAVFVKAETPSVSFFVDMPKEIKNAAKFIGKDGLRPYLTRAYIDVDKRSLVATNAYILCEYSIAIEGSTPALPSGRRGLFIDEKAVKRLSGRIRVDVSEDQCSGEITAFFSDEAGNVYVCDQNNLRFPDYHGIIPSKVFEAGHAIFTRKSAAALRKFVKRAAAKNVEIFKLTINSGSTQAFVSYKDEYTATSEALELDLKDVFAGSVSVEFKVQNFVQAASAWSGSIWFHPSAPAVLDLKGARVALIFMSGRVFLDKPSGEVEVYNRSQPTAEPSIAADDTKAAEAQATKRSTAASTLKKLHIARKKNHRKSEVLRAVASAPTGDSAATSPTNPPAAIVEGSAITLTPTAQNHRRSGAARPLPPPLMSLIRLRSAAPCVLVDTPPLVRRLPYPPIKSFTPDAVLKYSLIARMKNHSLLNFLRPSPLFIGHGLSRHPLPPYTAAHCPRTTLRSPKSCAYLYASHTFKKLLIARMKNQRILPIRGSPPHNRTH